VLYRRGAFQDLLADYEASVAALRNAMGSNGFEAAWAQGAPLSTEEATTYAQRGQANSTWSGSSARA
jgi:hypothetical protein